MTKCVLTIAASDPSGGAGIEADLKVFSAHRLFGLTAITAITVQDTASVRSVHPVEPAVFRHVLEHLRLDQPLAAIKIGALSSLAHLEAVHDFLASFNPRPAVVFDPVIRASSGAWLCGLDAVEKFPALIFPWVTLLTPNAVEAGMLTGTKVNSREAQAAAAQALARLGPEAVLVKGGHMPRDSHDVLCHRGQTTEWPNDLLPRQFHGTGCALSAAIASQLALGADLPTAVVKARAYLRLAMQRARPGAGEVYILDFPPAEE